MNIREVIRARVTERKKANRNRHKSQTKKPSGHPRSVPNHLKDMLIIRKKINKLEKKSRPKLRLHLERELYLHDGINYLVKTYKDKRIMKWFWTPNFIKNGLPQTTDVYDYDFEHDLKTIHQSLTREHLRPRTELLNWFAEQVEIITDEILEKYPKLKPITELERYALFRYWTVGALSNISLSVAPEKKREWGINFELFGSFYNTDNPYCGLYPELEERCVSDVFRFVLQPDMTILVNPPYTEEWIEKACELVNQYLQPNTNIEMNTTIWLVLPVWNTIDRMELGLEITKNMPILDSMKFSPYLVSHEITRLPFYNGLEKKHVYLHDKVHVYHLSNKRNI